MADGGTEGALSGGGGRGETVALRKELERVNFAAVDPVELMLDHEKSRLKLTKTKKLSRIKAPSWAES